jgi:transketolase
MSARCLEQIRNDICYQRRAVRLIGVGAGFSYGTLGPSHHALEDATIMAALPELVVANPGNAAELDRCYAALLDDPRPAYFRIARESGAAYGAPIFSPQTAAFAARRGADVTLATSGGSVTQCLAAAEILAAEGIEASVVSVPILQPFPVEAFAACLTGAPVVAVFEGYRGNPLSVGIMETLLARGGGEAFIDLTAPHAFPSLVGDTETLRRRAGLDPASIAARARALIEGRGARKLGARA